MDMTSANVTESTVIETARIRLTHDYPMEIGACLEVLDDGYSSNLRQANGQRSPAAAQDRTSGRPVQRLLGRFSRCESPME